MSSAPTDSQSGYRQSIPLSWLQSPEDGDRFSLMEFARGTLYGLARLEAGAFGAVHVSRVRNSFNRLGSATLCRVALRLLELLREAEPVMGGYWLLTPYRVVEINGKFMFVGAAPNMHGLLGGCTRHGLSRFVSKDTAENLPHQALENWMGASDHDPASVVAALISGHKLNSAKTSGLSGVEFLSLPSTRDGHIPFLWTDQPNKAALVDQIAICRQRAHGSTRFFSASVRNGSVISEAPINIEAARLFFSVASHLGSAPKAIIRSSERETSITLNLRLPAAEYRLALAISTQTVRSGLTTTFTAPTELAPVLLSRIAKLGCFSDTLI